MKNMEKVEEEKTLFGFWVYLMTDCMLFATLFVTYAVLRKNTYGGPDGHELFSMPYVLIETMILLTSSFTCGLAMLAAKRGAVASVMNWFALTFLGGLAFLAMELHEFSKLINEGSGYDRSGFLSGFFTLVGTHGLHITFGLIWMAVMLVYIAKKGLNSHIVKRLAMLSMFWHFLDVVWIFIFTVVYLTGVAL